MTGSKESFTLNFKAPEFSEELRSEGAEFLQDLPVPNRKTERWKYSPIAKLLNGSLKTFGGEGLVWPEEILPDPVPFLNSYRIVFRNGTYVSSLSDLPVAEGVVCSPLSEVDSVEFKNTYHRKEWVGAMNATYHQDGLFLTVDKNVVLDRPIVVHHLTDGSDTASFLRHFISLGEGAGAEVVVWCSATDASSGMCNSLLEGHIASNAYLVIDKVCNEEGRFSNFRMNT